MSTVDLVKEVCTRRLRSLTKLSRDEMRLAAYLDGMAEIDVCAGGERHKALQTSALAPSPLGASGSFQIRKL